jgi:ectonucleotide pyrophosphatase/phosphodiesterase family member 5
MKFFNLILLAIFSFGCGHITPEHQEAALDFNNSKHIGKPIVLLISIDGYRHDYNEMYRPPFLSQFHREGSSAKGLRPVYPTNTFPNHYSIVTGLYPDHHGIIANSFFAPDLERSYSLRDSSSVTDGAFYQGIPLWSLARLQGMVSATYFWPGSEAKIAGARPSYYRAYNHSAPHEDRIQTVLSWLKLPAQNRPHFVTLYFSDVDSAGHAHGPESPQVKEAILKTDQSIKQLMSEIEKLNLPVITMIVSDHGMKALSFDRVEYINDSLINEQERSAFKDFETQGMGPFLFHYYKGEPSRQEAATNLVLNAFQRGKNFNAYKRGQLPAHLKFNKNIRMGELVTIASPGYSVGERSKLRVIAGGHGFDPSLSDDMNGIFWVQGPSIKKGVELPVIENIHLYPLIAKLLGLEFNHNEIDGDLQQVIPVLKN